MTKRALAAGKTTSGMAPPACYPRRLRQLLEAAIVAQGNLEAVQAALRIRGQVLRQRLSVLRAHGAARTVHLHDPRRQGRPCEVIALVRLSAYDRAEMDRFEQSILTDRAITTASRIVGAYDYQLFAFHPDLKCAERWARDLAGDALVSRVQMTPVRTIYGHNLPGLVLHGACLEPRSPLRRSLARRSGSSASY